MAGPGLQTKPRASRPRARAVTGLTLAEHLFAEIGESIVRGDLPPGSKVSEPVMARRYGVSRGPLREALHRLQERKLIVRAPNQGARVVQPSAAALQELFAVREALEGVAAREAARHIRDDEILALRDILARHEAQLAQAATHPFSDGSPDRDFHFKVAQASRNPLLIDLLCQEFYPLLRLYRGPHPTPGPARHRTLTEHRRILDAIVDHDLELAEMQMRRHVAAARLRREPAICEGGETEEPVVTPPRKRPRRAS